MVVGFIIACERVWQGCISGLCTLRFAMSLETANDVLIEIDRMLNVDCQLLRLRVDEPTSIQ